MAEGNPLLSLLLFNRKGVSSPVVLHYTMDLQRFGFFSRGSVREILTFASREVASRTNLGERTCVKHKPKDLELEFLSHCYVTPNSLACVVISNADYDKRVAFSLINKALEEAQKVYAEKLFSVTVDSNLQLTEVAELFGKFQRPAEVDNIVRVQKDLDETREVLVQSIDKLLVRGERLEELMEKSQDLSFQSKAFMKNAKSLNSCCSII